MSALQILSEMPFSMDGQNGCPILHELILMERKNDDGVKKGVRFSRLHEVTKTVVFLEHGLPNAKKRWPSNAVSVFMV